MTWRDMSGLLLGCTSDDWGDDEAAGKPAGAARRQSTSVGIRFASALALTTQKLRPSTVVFAQGFLWRYRPRRPFRGDPLALGAELGLAPRTVKRALSELRMRDILVENGGGLVCPLVEARVHDGLRVQSRMEFDWSATPPSARQYLGTRADEADLDRVADRRAGRR